MSASASLSYSDQLEAAATFFRENDDFLVVSHVHPDGDAVSSTLAVGHLLKQLGKSFTMINEGRIPAKFKRLEGALEIVDYSQKVLHRSFRVVICVDCADYTRMGQVVNLFAEDVKLLNIDHHPTNNRFGSLAVIRENAAATVEMVYEIGMQLNADWPLALCESIYTGLLTDTGGFRYSNTTPKVMKIASDMLERGVVGNELAERFLESITYAQIELLRVALATLQFAYNKRVAYIYVTSEDMASTHASSEDLEGISSYPRNIEGVEVGIFFKQTGPDTFKASLRSAGKVNVSQIAQQFGGGGHVRASGCTLAGPLNIVINALVEEVGKALS